MNPTEHAHPDRSTPAVNGHTVHGPAAHGRDVTGTRPHLRAVDGTAGTASAVPVGPVPATGTTGLDSRGRDASSAAPTEASRPGRAGRNVRLTRASGIRIRPALWLWEDRIPHGALVLGPGREGIGKSLFCAWLTTQVTRGTLPGIRHGEPRPVIYAATEDSWERTIAGRLQVAGADLDQVYRIEVDHPSSFDGTSVTVPLSLPRDCDALAAEIDRLGVALLILDPLISAVDSRIDVNGEKLREALEPLVKLADQTGCSIFGLAHFNKASGTDVLSRITGSRAFAAVARAVIAFARDTTADDGSCVLSQAKNNLGRLDLPSLRYVVDSIEVDTEEGPGEWGRLQFIGETDVNVDDLLNDSAMDPAERTDRDEAADWLTDYLTDQGGSAASSDIKKAAKGAAISERTLARARQALKVTTTTGDTFPRKTIWSLP